MPAVTVKSIPPALYRDLKKSAAKHRRSINREVIAGLEAFLRSRPLDPESLLLKARLLRSRTKGHPLSDEALQTAKEAGRP